MEEVSIWLDLEGYGLKPGDSTQINLYYDMSQGCVTLPEHFTATQNGRSLPILSRGGWSPPTIRSSGGCGAPTVTAYVPDPSEESTTFVFSDGVDTRVVEFRNLTAPMSLRLLEPQDGVLRPGQTAVLEYFPATDLLVDPMLGLEAENPQLAGSSSGIIQRREGSTFTLTVPVTAVPGPAKLSLSGTTYAGTSQCPYLCGSRQRKQASLPVTIAPFELPAGKVTP
jgi:hypothetical protein